LTTVERLPVTFPVLLAALIALKRRGDMSSEIIRTMASLRKWAPFATIVESESILVGPPG